MYFVTLKEDNEELGLIAGIEYACTSDNAGIFMLKNLGTKARWVDEHTAGDPTSKDILVMRAGGYGDQLFLTPSLRELKRREPDCRITQASLQSPAYNDALQGLPYIDSLIAYPFPASIIEGKRLIWLENSIEHNEDGHITHAVDQIARCVFGDVMALADQDRRMDYKMHPEEFAAANTCFPRIDRARIGIQAKASTPTRSYPPELLSAVMSELALKGYEVFMFGKPGELEVDMPEITDLTSFEPAPTFRGSCAVLSTCDVVLAPDSSLLHVAGALNIPTLGLYGSFPWKLRTAYAPSVQVLNGHGPCAPCSWSGGVAGLFPPHGPCNQTGRCEVLASITPERIVARIVQMLPENLRASKPPLKGYSKDNPPGLRPATEDELKEVETPPEQVTFPACSPEWGKIEGIVMGDEYYPMKEVETQEATESHDTN